jgi:hypothetical protein
MQKKPLFYAILSGVLFGISAPIAKKHDENNSPEA